MLEIDGKQVLTTLAEVVEPRHTALVIIDIQNDFVMPGGFCDRKLGWADAARKIVPNVKRVLEGARQSKVLVVHIQMTYFPGFRSESAAFLRRRLLRTGFKVDAADEKLEAQCIEGTWGWRLLDELAPLPNEVVVRKHRSSSFHGTNLDLVLRSNGIKSVVMVGLWTQGCVMATASDAWYYDYNPVVLTDCVTSHDPVLHDAAMLIMSRVRDVVASEEVLSIWRKGASA